MIPNSKSSKSSPYLHSPFDRVGHSLLHTHPSLVSRKPHCLGFFFFLHLLSSFQVSSAGTFNVGRLQANRWPSYFFYLQWHDRWSDPVKWLYQLYTKKSQVSLAHTSLPNSRYNPNVTCLISLLHSTCPDLLPSNLINSCLSISFDGISKLPVLWAKNKWSHFWIYFFLKITTHTQTLRESCWIYLKNISRIQLFPSHCE